MKKFLASYVILLIMSLKIQAQENRLPICISSTLSIPTALSNPAFKKTCMGTMDWKSCFTYQIKNHSTLSLIYKKNNFKIRANEDRYVKSFFIINSFGIGYKKIIYNNPYFTFQSGINLYYSNSKFTKIFFNKVEATNLKNQFYLFEPEVLLTYKASEYVDIGFSLTGNISTYMFDPFKLKLDESDYKISYADMVLKKNVVSFLTIGFQCNWYFQFEKLE